MNTVETIVPALAAVAVRSDVNRFPYGMPWEIVLDVADLLSPSDRASLGLSCKFLYNSEKIFRKSGLVGEELGSLLSRFEKNRAGIFYCAYCNKLKSISRYYNDDGYPREEEEECSGEWKHALVLDEYYKLTYNLARLVMNRHFHGKGHGFAPSVLNWETTGMEDMENSSVVHKFAHKHSWTAKIIDDELYVRGVYQATSCTPDMRHFRHYIVKTCRGLANHFHGEKLHENEHSPAEAIRAALISGWIPPERNELFNSQNGLKWLEGRSMGCTRCHMDFDIKTSWTNDGFTINIVTYRRLGVCRDAWDDSNPAVPAHHEYWPSGRGGIVKHAWLESEGLHRLEPRDLMHSAVLQNNRQWWISSHRPLDIPRVELLDAENRATGSSTHGLASSDNAYPKHLWNEPTA